MSPPRDGATGQLKRRVQHHEYVSSKNVPHEVDMALNGLFKAMPEAPVAWLAEYFCDRAVELGVPCEVSRHNTHGVLGRLGGVAAITGVVDMMYTRIASDPRVNHVLGGLSIESVKGTTIAGLCKALGCHADTNLPPVGKHVTLTDDNVYQAFVSHLRMSLVDLNFSPREVADIIAAYASLRKGAAKVLFERIGGTNAVDIAVEKFYSKVLQDVRVAHFFYGIEMRGQRKKQKSFLTYVFGGAHQYSARNMRDGHRHMVRDKGLNDKHFDVIVQLLSSTLKELGVGDSDISEVRQIAESVRDDVLCKGEGHSRPLYDRIGGAKAVDTAVDKFYQKVLQDVRVAHFFYGVDMRGQRQKQKSFLTYVFGGPNNYSARNMRDGHRHMVRDKGLNDSHFDVIVQLLSNTMKDMGVSDSDIEQMRTIAESVRNDVLCKGEGLGSDTADKVIPVESPAPRTTEAASKMPRPAELSPPVLPAQPASPVLTVTKAPVRSTVRPVITMPPKSPIHHLASAMPRRDDTKESLYDRLGGAVAVEVAVELFYQKILSDTRVSRFYEKINMVRLKQKQKSFLTYVFGGPNNYTARNMRDGHRLMVRDKGMTDAHFDAVVELLASTMQELGVDDRDILEVAEVAEAVRDDVLCRGDVVPKSLYERLGGAQAVEVAVDKFYGKVVADARLSRFFEGVDMNAQRTKQKAFLSFAFGGPNQYTGKNMRDAHRRLVIEQGLGDVHYDAIVELLALTLKELGVHVSDIEQVATIAESVRGDILCKGEKHVKPLFERVGGPEIVEKAVDKYYEKVLGDNRVRHFFEGIDMRRQRIKQKAFLTYALGGLSTSTPRSLRDAHRSLVAEKGLNDVHFNAVVELLGSTLRELGVDDADIADVGRVVEGVRDDVLCREEKRDHESLYERLGGAVAVDVAVDRFYEKVLSDKRVCHFF
eukprot:TRINITY_DN1294_c0_g1_i3.p1 TRINITY_DN1294_c0_g1~~TRINITY_DN1294_c0_g1_i3.p1  ORF type:complete len:932 (+),score=377.44 TRINITY_DN1294_c0_g1_i3:73-2868(+)